MATDDRYGELLHLEANSAYVSLTQLMQPGRFHWSLFITDTSGVATRYHWAEVRRRAASTDPVEAFMFGIVDPVTEITRGNTYTLVFAKIGAFTASTTFDYRAQFATLFRASYDNVKDNRKHDLSCRTWLMAALQRMREHHLVNLTEAKVAAIEPRLTSEALKAEGLLAACALSDPATTFNTLLITV